MFSGIFSIDASKESGVKDMRDENMDNEMISVIVPVYNIRAYIKECIDSIICQTYRNLEIILVDDGSTDGCGEICDRYEKADARVRVVHKQNGGLSSARNCGISLSKGKYLLFVDGDDKIDVKMCEILIHILRIYHADISICRSYKNELAKNHRKHIIVRLTPEKALSEMLKERSFNVSAWGKLYKRELFETVRFPDSMLFEDLAVTYRLLDLSHSAVYTSEQLYYYRVRNGSIMNSTFSESKMVFLDISEEMIRFLAVHYPKALTAAYNRTTRYCISFIRDIAVSSGDYHDYACRLRNFIKKHIMMYLRSDYKISSKVYGLAIAVNLTVAEFVYRCLNDFWSK